MSKLLHQIEGVSVCACVRAGGCVRARLPVCMRACVRARTCILLDRMGIKMMLKREKTKHKFEEKNKIYYVQRHGSLEHIVGTRNVITFEDSNPWVSVWRPNGSAKGTSWHGFFGRHIAPSTVESLSYNASVNYCGEHLYETHGDLFECELLVPL